MLGLPISFSYGLVLVAVFAYVMACTPLGRHMRFVGANREVSRLSGIRVNRIRFGSFVMAGALAGLGATGIPGLQLLNLQKWISNVFYGGVLVLAVTITTLLRRRVS